ncbi:hypothetical protein Y032_0168g184 [Ancylostoma ceylanicum]|uniref:Uncharacterized protein n=1 Tax=Ancylostoma ceylanicum TaxID=53326 RepID=A0A016SWJ0_9BILA|nr:hypothetical protein Y032_0168g184 [Ancylostoma ceylanicum]
MQENLQEIRSSISGTPPVGATCGMGSPDREANFVHSLASLEWRAFLRSAAVHYQAYLILIENGRVSVHDPSTNTDCRMNELYIMQK